jgi:hypothetical protein
VSALLGSWQLEGDRLTSSGPDFRPGTKRMQQIVWRCA